MAHQYHHREQLKKNKYRNWVKAGLGLKYLKEGLEDFTEDKIKEQHQYILDTVKQKNNLTSICCGQCSLRTLQPDHIRNKYKQCPLSNKDCNCQYPGGKSSCPNNVCGAIYDQIILNHASNPSTPSWKNSDVQKWCIDPWEVAKCYINAPGYASKSNASDIDCTGLLHIFINSKFLQKKLQCKITGQDVFSKTRSARNSIFHSNSMEMEAIEVNGYVDNMIAVLEDGKELVSRPESKAAVEKIVELKNTSFVISTMEEDEVIREAMSEINLKETELKQTVENATNEMQRSQKEAVNILSTANEELKDTAQQKIDMIEKSGDVMKREIEFKGQTLTENISAMAKAKTEDCDTIIRKRKHEACDEIESAKRAAIESLTKSYENVSKEMRSTVTKEAKEEKADETVKPNQKELLSYTQSKEDLKRSLIEMYTENVVNISPVLLQPEHNDVSVGEFYIDPLIEIVPISQKEKNETDEKSERLQSYREMFKGKEDKRLKLIYLIGEAGSGKSTFCINMINNWCIAHSGREVEVTENIEEMKRYEFLFYLPLRYEINNDHVEDMIIVHYDDHIIKEVLEKEPESCLILMDGLDEWVLDATQKLCSPFQSKGLPRRNLRKAYTIITTSRAWKFESIGIKNTEIHKRLHLRGLKDIRTMVKKTIDVLNDMFKKRKNVSDFENDLIKYQIDSEMTLKPMILQQLICLWFEGKLKCVGKVALYSSMLNMFFEWTAQRHIHSDVLEELRAKRPDISNFDIPEQCNAMDVCPELRYVIEHIGKLAYATRRESSLYLNDATFRRLEIPNEVISYCLKSSILSQRRVSGLSLSRRQHMSFSFVHESMQEFLCALYILSELKKTSTHLFKPFILQTIDKNTTCLRETFDYCKTADDILEQSNVFIFLCGFNMYLAANISKFVYNIVVADDTFIDYRTNLAYKPFDTIELAEIDFHGHRANVSRLQNLVFAFIKETKLHSDVRGRFFFHSDFAYGLSGSVDLDLIKYINTAFVLSINFDIWETQLQSTLSDFLNDPFLGPKMSTLKLNISCFIVLIPGELFSTLFGLLKRSKLFLKSLLLKSKVYTGSPSIMRLFVGHVLEVLPVLNKLETVQLENLDITFDQIMELSRWIKSSKSLRQISLRKVTDHPNDDVIYPDSPFIDLSGHHRLQFLDYDFGTIEMTYFSVHNLELCSLYLQNYFILITAFNLLKQSHKLKCAYLRGHLFRLNDKLVKVTRQFQELLPRLSSLKRLHLEAFPFTENIIVEPLQMQNLELLLLESIEMDEKCWIAFFDNVLLMPQNVTVVLIDCVDRFLTGRLNERIMQVHNILLRGNSIKFSTKPFDA